MIKYVFYSIFLITLFSKAQSIDLHIVPQNTLCHGYCDGTISCFATNGTPPYKYLWSPGGETSNYIQNLCAGTYILLVTDANNQTKSDSIIIADAPPIQLNYTVSPDTVLIGQYSQIQVTSNVSAAYLWSPSTFLSCDHCMNPICSPDSTTCYKVVVESNEYCKDSSLICVYVYTKNAVNEFNTPQELQISPNPFSNQTTLKSTHNLEGVTLKIQNIFGQLIRQFNSLNGNVFNINRDGLADGTYTLLLSKEGVLITSKKITIISN